jgi:hypothetical protein
VTNENNVYSSWLNKVLCTLEDRCLDIAVNLYRESVRSLIFDGCHIDASVKIDLEELNALTAPVKWAIKPMVVDIQIPSEFNPEDSNDYAMQKQKTETYPCGMVHWAMIEEPSVKYIRIFQEAVMRKNLGMVMKWTHNLHNREDWLAYMRKYQVPGKKGLESIHKQLECDPDQQTFARVDFTPFADGEVDEMRTKGNVFNTFYGFSANVLDACDLEFIEPFLTLVYNLAGRNQECMDYLLNWQAQIFQRPATPTECMVMVKGPPGTGKDTWVDITEAIMGSSHNYVYRTSVAGEVVGPFNAAGIDGKIMTVFNEFSSADGAKYLQELTDLITRESNNINQKHQAIVTKNNYVNCLAFTNLETFGIAIPHGCRKFWVCTTSMTLKGKIAFWVKIRQLIKNTRWLDHVYTFYMQRDISNFDAQRDRPITDEYRAAQARNVPAVWQFMHEQSDDKFGEWDTVEHSDPWDTYTHRATKEEIKNLYSAYRTRHFSDKDAPNFKPQDMWDRFDNALVPDDAVKWKHAKKAPESEKRAWYYYINAAKMKAYLETHQSIEIYAAESSEAPFIVGSSTVCH